MPVVGTPVVTGYTLPDQTPAPVACTAPVKTCQDQNRISPEVSSYYGKLLLARMKSVRIRTGQHARIQWTMTDSQGNVVDLTECGFSSSGSPVSSSSSSASHGIGMRCRIRENLSLGYDPQPARTEYPVSVIDAANGLVEIVLDKRSTGVPGVYFAEVAVFNNFGDDDLEQMLFSNVFYLLIERGQFGANKHQAGGPPTIMEIRLHLRDSSPEESLLLDNIRFDDAEIALAISRPLDYWNEIPPDLGVRATTQNFPWRYHWLEAICANLFFMASEHFRANNLQYSAAGVQVNDQDKEPNYLRAADRHQQSWLAFVQRKKGAINLEQAWSEVGSPYGRAGF